MPRFIISVRELYDRDSRGRVYGIDSGFGVVSQHDAGQDATVSGIAFADNEAGGDQSVEGNVECQEGIQVEVRGDNEHCV